MPRTRIGAQQKDIIRAENQKDAVLPPKERALRSPFSKNFMAFRIKPAYRNSIRIELFWLRGVLKLLVGPRNAARDHFYILSSKSIPEST
ncbi:hypothetical protein AGR1B_pTi0005 [Agrobacterium fabacearum S56]|nr:hypothetical protein AGR1B_pTi0005 [Agrobacterium fabacearum S56]